MSQHCKCNSPADRVLYLLDELKHALIEALEESDECATKSDLRKMEGRIMATLGEQLATLQSGMDQLAAAQTEFTVDLKEVADNDTKLLATIVDLKAQIDALNAGGGTVGPADQPAIDKLQASISAAVDQAKAGNAATLALVPPVVTPPPAAA